MFIKLLFFAAIFTTCVASRRGYCRAPSPKPNNTESEIKYNEASIALSAKFLSDQIATTGNNCVLSGPSLSILLALLATFSEGKVRQELLPVLNMNSPAEIKSVIPVIIKGYEDQTGNNVTIATQCSANKNYQLTQNFIKTANDIFHAEVNNLDFSKNVAAAKILNDWVQKKTHDKIKDLISPSSLSSSTTLVCMNAIYFMGNWVHQFKERDTIPRDFYLSETKKVQIPIMYQENYFGYYEDPSLKIQALEMPYKGGNFTFLIILPNGKDMGDLKAVAKKMQKPSLFEKIITSLRRLKVQVYCPKFKIETKMDMVPMMKKVNVTEVFKPNSNGLKGITVTDQPLYISDIVQKAFIEVNEKGTEAAAATAISIRTLSLPIDPPPVQVFNVDHPFLFYIVFKKTIMFCGAFLGGETINY